MASLTLFSKFVTLLVLALICFVPKGLSLSKDDKIVTLPGQPPVGFNQYGGYVTVDDKQERALYYYFVEAETEPQTKPLVLWLNGGPGCSGTWTAFGGNGPFLPKEDDSLIKTNFSWNREANMLYLDAPAGVGFSYSTDKSYYNFTNDEITAQDNLKFLFGWLEKFPEYKNRDFFITGVSYAGHFVPQLANLILESRLKSNLKGIALGSPMLDFYTDYNSREDFIWSHGMISDSTYSMFKSICNMSQAYGHYYATGNLTSPCSQVLDEYIVEVGNFINILDVLNDVCISSSPFLPEPKENEPDACLQFKLIKYLNKKDVQEALHAKLVGIDEWKPCSGFENIGYDLRDVLVPTLPLLGKLLQSGVRAMIYSGDQDSLIPLLGTRRLLNGLANNLGLNSTVPYRSWLHNKQVGGWTQVYGDILSFATIRGGGHEASFSKPERTLAVFQSFLLGKPLPLAKTN